MNERDAIYQRLLLEKKETEIQKLEEYAEVIRLFKEYCVSIGINSDNIKVEYIESIGIVAISPNIIEKLCPYALKDKEGLYNFKMLCQSFSKRYVAGFLYSENFMIMAHPFFRRGLHQNSNFAPNFIDLFWRQNKAEIEQFIAIDSDRVRINVDDSGYMELDTWYGPQFRTDVGKISDGVTHLRPAANIPDFIIEFYFDNTYSLDIKWETKDGIKSFQAEEFKVDSIRIDKNGNQFFPARYLHAEFDISKNKFRHFDGAMHFYTEEEYYIRRDFDLNYNSKNLFKIKTTSEKLFKFNGNISIDSWIEYTSQFMTKNPLVIEYFDGSYPEHVDVAIKAFTKNT